MCSSPPRPRLLRLVSPVPGVQGACATTATLRSPGRKGGRSGLACCQRRIGQTRSGGALPPCSTQIVAGLRGQKRASARDGAGSGAGWSWSAVRCFGGQQTFVCRPCRSHDGILPVRATPQSDGRISHASVCAGRGGRCSSACFFLAATCAPPPPRGPSQLRLADQDNSSHHVCRPSVPACAGALRKLEHCWPSQHHGLVAEGAIPTRPAPREAAPALRGMKERGRLLGALGGGARARTALICHSVLPVASWYCSKWSVARGPLLHTAVRWLCLVLPHWCARCASCSDALVAARTGCAA